MWLESVAPIFNILLDSSMRTVAVTVAVAGILFAARIRSPHLHHRMWTGVLCAMMLMPLLSWIIPPLALPYRAARVFERVPIVGRGFSSVAPISPESNWVPAAFSSVSVSPSENADVPEHRPIWPTLILVVYGVGILFFLVRQIAGWLAITHLLRLSQPAIAGYGSDIAESDAVSTPLTCGIVRPRIVLPANWLDWSPQKLRSVLIHERAHIRRRDALVGFFARLNCAVFWFHPIAWWLERKLATSAEDACDDEVVRELGEPQQYAAVLVEIAEDVHRRGGRISWQGIGVEGKGTLRYRIDRLLDGNIGDILQNVPVGRKAAIALLCVGTIYLAAACRKEPAATSEEVAQLRQEIAELRSEIKNLSTNSGRSARVDPNARNPFHFPDVPDPDGIDVQQFAATVNYLGTANDANAEQWVKTASEGDPATIDGEWIGRWNNTGGDWVPSYPAFVKSVGDRVYILYTDHQGRFLADLHRDKDRLVGRLVGVDNPGDSSLCVIRIVSTDRLDGTWSGKGRLDFRRKLQ